MNCELDDIMDIKFMHINNICSEILLSKTENNIDSKRRPLRLKVEIEMGRG